MKVVLVSLVCLILAGAIERLILHHSLRMIPIRVVVNGTRGKSTVVRLLAAALREAGIPTLGRSTGSIAELVLPDGSLRAIARRGVVNLVREQRQLVRLANGFDAKALVCECSAIRPELQRVFQRQLVEPTLTLITNSYVDHVDQLGETRESTAEVLASGVHRFLTTDPVLGALPGAVVVPDLAVPSRIPQWVHPDCYRIALAACAELGIPQEVAIRGMCGVQGDIGMSEDLVVGGKRFINEGLLCDYPMSYGSEQTLHNNPWYAIVDQTYVDAMTTEGLYDYMTARGAVPGDQDDPSTNWFIGNYFKDRVLDKLPEDIEEGIAEGWLWKGDTIEEVAEKAGLPVENVVATVERYNGYCETGVDEEFGTSPWYLSPVKDGPFYITQNYQSAWSTFGGLRIDDQCRVLAAETYLPIDGLYCVGTEAGSLYYSPYYDIPGYCYGLCIDSGYIAATEACAYAGVTA